jgi:hypothetical protein
VVPRNRVGGPESVIDEVERRAPDGFERLADVIDAAELESVLSPYAAASGASRAPVNPALTWTYAPSTDPGGRKFTSCSAARRTTSAGSCWLWSWSNSAASRPAGLTQNSPRVGTSLRL